MPGHRGNLHFRHGYGCFRRENRLNRRACDCAAWVGVTGDPLEQLKIILGILDQVCFLRFIVRARLYHFFLT